MSRVGSKSIEVPVGVSVSLGEFGVRVSGAYGELTVRIPNGIRACLECSASRVNVVRDCDDSSSRSLHGLTRSLIANAVVGVATPWQRRLEIIGVGYQASFSNHVLSLNVGFANPLLVEVPEMVRCDLLDSTHINLASADKQLVGQVAANIRRLRPPEPYKGKGIRYVNEHVRRKSGKAFGS